MRVLATPGLQRACSMPGDVKRCAPLFRSASLPGSLPSRPAPEECRPRRRSAAPCRSAVQAAPAAPSTAAVPRQIPSHAVELRTSGQSGGGRAYGAPLCGCPTPLGATYMQDIGGINFALYSSSATGVTLVLFTEQDLTAGRATHEVPLDPALNRTGDVWHILLPAVDTSLLYGYRVAGPHQDEEEQEEAVAAAAAAAAAAGVAEGTMEGAESTYEEGGDASEADEPKLRLKVGHRHNETKVVVDPYATAVLTAGRRSYGQMGPDLDYLPDHVLGLAPTWPQSAGYLPQPGGDGFDWEGDRPLNLPMEDLVIYEMHVRGFTQHSSSGVQAPGTYLGLVEKLDYLQSLGVTAIELLPVHEFNELEYYAQIPGSSPPEFRYNFWGYSTLAFMAPMARYSYAVSQGADGAALAAEFKLLVREAHKRGIEVILDVVFNHTAEGNEQGPTLSFRGIDNRTYYMLAPGGEYYNYSGCGNTFNTNHPVVRSFILDALRHWVTEYHVDGFRFDLASILTRAHSAWHPSRPDAEGNPLAPHSEGDVPAQHGIMNDSIEEATGTPLPDPPLVEVLSEDPVLRHTKLIAEAWDCGPLTQVGAFPHYGGRWSEWNGTFRDTVRAFIKGSDGPWAGAFASAMCGSPNIYANDVPAETDWWGNNGGRRWKGGRQPNHSINFITAHDGFSLADLVAYNEKHNEANGEGNRDGEGHNLSWNCGEEGPTKTIGVNRLRQRQMRNLASALLLAHGVPMVQMGDEAGHTKHGNNNTYCHDSPLNWLDWSRHGSDEAGFARFMARLIKFRSTHPELRRRTYVSDRDITWHGQKANEPDWSEASRLVAYTLSNHRGGGLYIAFNTAHVPTLVELPHWPGRTWHVIVDTSRLAPYDFLVADEELSQEEVDVVQASHSMWTGSSAWPLLPWSCVVLESVEERPAAPLRSRTRRASTGNMADAQAASSAPTTPTANGKSSKASRQGLMGNIKAAVTGT